MTRDEIMKMPIENVSERMYLTGAVDILFDIAGCWYKLTVYDTDKHYYLGGIYHRGRKKTCSFCHQTRDGQMNCDVLESQEVKALLFQRLIESNSIRLNWLYREPIVE